MTLWSLCLLPSSASRWGGVCAPGCTAVGQAKGVLYLAASEVAEPPREYSPLEVKRAVTGYGRASKIQMQEMTKVILGLPSIPRPDHAADALAVAITHAHTSAGLAPAMMRRVGE